MRPMLLYALTSIFYFTYFIYGNLMKIHLESMRSNFLESSNYYENKCKIKKKIVKFELIDDVIAEEFFDCIQN